MKIRKLLVFAALVFSGVVSVNAQEGNPMMQPIPTDPAVKMGKLENGLTYYVRHNGYPEKRVNFYIAQRVGSLQEEENQRGLAHFLEHMCFNGTKNFPGNGVIEYTRSLGVQFGGDLNAYTSIDQTVYNINNVPTTRGVAALDSCLLILKDWSHDLTLDPKEIDQERGVIHEEWRLRTSASSRMFERNLEKLYPGSKYGKRYPIGLMSVIDNFKPKALRDYYEKWYHPTNQAIIVIGDIDVDRTVAKIKEMFSDIKNPENPAKVELEPVPDNPQPIIIVDKDKEEQTNSIQMMFKSESTPEEEKAYLSYLLEDYVKDMASSMICARFQEEALKPDAPFAMAAGYAGNYIFAKTKDAFTFYAMPKEGKTEETLKALTREAKRAVEYGFTATEYERAKADYLSSLEKQYTNRDKINNDVFGRACASNYLENEPLMSIEQKYQLMQQLVPMLPVEIINSNMSQLISINDSNVVIFNTNTEKEGLVYPTEASLKKAYDEARAEKVEAYVDNVKQEPLIANMPKPGKIVSEKEGKKFGYKELTLSNGARVLLKKTNLKEGEVIMEGSSKGGSSLYGLNDRVNLDMFDAIIGSSGLGNFTATELQKVLAGKNANVDLHLTKLHEYTSGSCTPKDMETMFQLNYLYFTDIKKDEQSIASVLNMYKLALKNKALSPESALSDSLQYTLHAHSPYYMSLEESDIDKVNYDRILQIAKERTANAADFTFTIVGNFDETLVRQYIEQYIASLPSIKKGKKYVTENWKPYSVYAKGSVDNTFYRKQETPKSNIYMFWYNNTTPWSLDNSIKADAAGQILDMVYLKTIREEQSAAYSAQAAGFAQLGGDKPFNAIYGYCPVKPEKKDIAVKIMCEELEKLGTTVDADMLNKTKDLLIKQYEDRLKTNGYWMGVVTDFDEFGVDKDTDYKKLVEALTPASVAKYVKDNIVGKNYVKVMMLPQE